MAINAGDGSNEVSGENFRALAATVVSGKNDDSIFLGSYTLETALTINAGNGNNNVFVEEFDVGQGNGPNELPKGSGAVTIVTGSGHDNVGAQFFDADNVVISTGSGDDGEATRPEAPTNNLQPILFTGPITVHDATITHSLVVSTGNGNDLVDIDDVVAHDIVVDTGAGNDGNDEEGEFPIEVDNVTVAGNVTVSGGPGNDRLEVRNEFDEVTGTRIKGNLVVSGGAGNDEITIGGDPGEDRGLDVGGSMIIDAGSGNDLVNIQRTNVGHVSNVQLGAGNDELDVFTSHLAGGGAILIANGGSGHDSFFNDLDINSNGNFDSDGGGTLDEFISNFEFFEQDAVVIKKKNY
jgi:hypothetical protein